MRPASRPPTSACPHLRDQVSILQLGEPVVAWQCDVDSPFKMLWVDDLSQASHHPKRWEEQGAGLCCFSTESNGLGTAYNVQWKSLPQRACRAREVSSPHPAHTRDLSYPSLAACVERQDFGTGGKLILYFHGSGLFPDPFAGGRE